MVDLYLYTSYGRWLETIFIPSVYPIWHASGHIIIKPYHVITWLRRFDLYNRHYCTRSFASRSNTLVHDCCGSHFTDKRDHGSHDLPGTLKSVNISKMWIISLSKHRTASHYLTFSTAQYRTFCYTLPHKHRTICIFSPHNTALFSDYEKCGTALFCVFYRT